MVDSIRFSLSYSQLTQIEHVRGTPLSRLQIKNPNDVVITMALRTPMCKARKGGFKDMRSDELLFATLKAASSRIPIPLDQIDDITVGTVLTPGAAYQARAACLAAGFKERTPVQVINRFCSSGLMAVSGVANQIRNQEIECGLAVGFESMTANPDRGISETGFCEAIMADPVAADCIHPMGWTSENVAKEFNISREKMDQFALMSHHRASQAQAKGLFKQEIMPLETWVSTSPGTDGKPSSREKRIVSDDDGIRHGSTAEQLAKVRPAFPQWSPSHTTGGNASQITDGGAVVLLMSRRKAEELKCEILAKYIRTDVVGLSPRIMGIGPSLAIPKLLAKVGLTIENVDLFEINEAFASMYVYCVEKLKVPIEKVNVNGGAIALGHPLGCTGARQVTTGLHELRRRRGKVLVTSMCIGLGMGAAGLILAEY
ncbi:hypothetical protein CROQUDRAFT_652579 [Cronartium quercuum f. sp. fusiforme G11]|uniref:3-ketoacyl-CoA thiolase n=1 Tax=Cronartium quercuum f. sp. fusiforme G11 TaxID=708437 RepID=A0A9P6NVD7_9BASI|nr:hypothetical protein CROQUDRAFT_652579 [Cronartium quercuum f. sp. fusiforme G11]